MAFAAIGLLTGCATHVSDNRSIRVTLVASPALNPDKDHHPAPVVVRLYGLSNRDSFDHATFFEMYDKDGAVLADAMLSRTVCVLQPGETVEVSLQLSPKIRAIGVMAAYEKIDQATWRAVVDVSPSTLQALRITADATQITAQVQATEPKRAGFLKKAIKHMLPKSGSLKS